MFGRSRFLFLISVLIAGGCSDVNLYAPNSAETAGEPPEIENVLPAIKVNNIERLVIITDMTNSAVQGSCPDEVDNPAYPSTTAKPCELGFDPTGDRFAWIRTWIQTYQSNSEITDLKVMIVPFAGGSMSHPLAGTDDLANMVFQTPAQALTYLNELNAINTATAQKYTSGTATDADSMGTSIIYQGLQWASTTIQQEIQNLGSNTYNTRFDVVAISDGVPTPRMVDYQTILGPCQPFAVLLAQGGNTCFSNADAFSCQTCSQYISLLTRNLGDPTQNDPDTVWFKALGLVALPKYLGYGNRLTLYLAQPHPETIPADRNQAQKNTADPAHLDDDVNMLQYISAKMNIPLGTSDSSTPPFSLGSSIVSGKSFRVSDFIVVNLNARIDARGTLITDSDADGTPDDVESQNGTDPTNPRSNGYCLDGITSAFGCMQAGCYQKVDADGDGLTNCEESTLSSSDYSVDTEGDGIPDLYKFLYSDRLSQDNRRVEDSPDGYSNKQNFLFGALAQADLSKVNQAYFVRTTMQFLGEINGSPGYQLQAVQIPVVNTLAVSDQLVTYRGADLNPQTQIDDAVNLGGTPHPAGMNQIVVLLKVVAVNDPSQIYYFIKRFEISYNQPNIPPINVSTFTQIY